MNLTIRNVDINNPDEVTEIRKIGARAFFNLSFLWPFLPKPTAESFVACQDDEIVSTFLYKIYGEDDDKIAYINYFYTDPKHHGKGFGKQVFNVGVRHLNDQNFKMIVSFVRDDNVGSWLSFVSNDFTRVPFSSLVPKLGFVRALRLYIESLFGFCFGHDFYVLEKEKITQNNPNSLIQIALFLLVNALLILPVAIMVNIFQVYAYFLVIFAGLVASGYIGTLFSDRKWRYRMPDGGLAICALFSITMGFLPMGANWYPNEYENSEQFRRDLALPAIFSWVFLLALGVLWSATAPLVQILLIFRCMIFAEPMKSYGGQRVYDWNKLVFAGLVALSAAFALFG